MGKSCSLGSQCVFLVQVSNNCQCSFFPTSVFGVGISFRLRLFLIIAYLYLSINVYKIYLDMRGNMFTFFFRQIEFTKLSFLYSMNLKLSQVTFLKDTISAPIQMTCHFCLASKESLREFEKRKYIYQFISEME